MYTARKLSRYGALALATALAHWCGGEDVRIIGFTHDEGVSRLEVSREDAWDSSIGTAELYRAAALAGPWSFVTNAALGGNDASLCFDEPSAKTLEVADLPDAEAAFFVAELYADNDGDGLSNAYERHVALTDPECFDTDGDGFDDGWEARYSVRLNPVEAEAEGWPRYFDPAGLAEYECDLIGYAPSLFDVYIEYQIGTNPFLDDTDGDGMPDDWEYLSGLDPTDATGDNGADGDPDGDWLTNAQEYEFGTEPLYSDTDFDGVPDGMEVTVYETDPRNPDSDGDGISDGDEITVYFTSPNAPDTDDDGLSDYEELYMYGTDPLSEDSDGDGASDYTECILWGTDPTDAEQDSDGDGLPDVWEIVHGMNPSVEDDSGLDEDCDGLTTAEEYAAGTDPTQPDTDGDGMTDGWEWTLYQDNPDLFDPTVNNNTDSEPLNDYDSDLDGDGMINGEECRYNTNPQEMDTDGDGVSDREELNQWSSPTDAKDSGFAKSRVRVEIQYGDPSESHSEKYLLHVWPSEENAPMSDEYRALNMEYGQVEGFELMLRPNVEYNMELVHASTSPDYEKYPQADPDYQLTLNQPFPWVVEVTDPDELLGTWSDESGTYLGEGKIVKLKAVKGNYAVTLTPDRDRNGIIERSDNDDTGAPLRFWVNGDKDGAGGSDVCDGSVNVDGEVASGDAEDEVVNGRRDLIDFTPLHLNLSSLSNCQDVANLSVILRQSDDAINVVWTGLSTKQAGSFQTKAVESIESAAVDQFEQGTCQSEPGPDWIESAINSAEKGVFLIEGRNATTEPLTVEVWYEDELLASTNLALSITSVKDFYRWVNLRGAGGASGNVGRSSMTDEPANRPESETDDRNFVFVHGYNVNAEQAEAWAAEMFKRLWQAGLKSQFTAVDWYGNESQWSTIFNGDISPDYYANVKHAFMTAGPMTAALGAIPGEKVMIGHSLGNMVVSSAAVDHGLVYRKYYMLNAAVAQEAYNASITSSAMVDSEWAQMDAKFRASRFYKLFETSGYGNDFRRTLSWKGRFAGIANAENCYSASEDVLGNASAEEDGGAWATQELLKGCAVWHGINILELPLTAGRTVTEAGWGVALKYCVNPAAYLPGSGFRPSWFENWQHDDLVTNPIFTAFDDSRMTQLEPLVIEDAELRAKLLGDAIPAESFAAGANETSGLENYNFGAAKRGDGAWPRNGGAWAHSDIKNVAYYYISGFFDKLVNER